MESTVMSTSQMSNDSVKASRLEMMFKAQREAYMNEPYMNLKHRRRLLMNLKECLQTHAKVIAEAIAQDFGHRSYHETYLLEVHPAIESIKFALKNMKKWSKPRRRHLGWLFQPAHAKLQPQPLGVVGIIVPWNYPLLMTVSPMVSALAAGNHVMLKLSESTENFGKLIEKLFLDSGIESKDVCVVNGDVKVGMEFSQLPFQHILFTGATAVGKLVMAAAAKNLTPVTLELGGKSPVVVSQSATENELQRLWMGKCFNSGQTCIAPDYLFIPEGWEDKVTQSLQQFFNRTYPNYQTNDDYSCVISDRHRQRLLGYWDDAVAKGGRRVEIADSKQAGPKLAPDLLFNVNDDMVVMQEEIFGPILPVMTYKHISEVVDYINKRPNPLALYYFGQDKKEQETLEYQTLSGGMAINETLLHAGIDTLPFGGVGASGMGHYHGQEGFDTFSKLKPVFHQRKLSTFTYSYPPYGKFVNMLMKHVAGIKKL